MSDIGEDCRGRYISYASTWFGKSVGQESGTEVKWGWYPKTLRTVAQAYLGCVEVTLYVRFYFPRVGQAYLRSIHQSDGPVHHTPRGP